MMAFQTANSNLQLPVASVRVVPAPAPALPGPDDEGQLREVLLQVRVALDHDFLLGWSLPVPL